MHISKYVCILLYSPVTQMVACHTLGPPRGCQLLVHMYACTGCTVYPQEMSKLNPLAQRLLCINFILLHFSLKLTVTLDLLPEA